MSLLCTREHHAWPVKTRGIFQRVYTGFQKFEFIKELFSHCRLQQLYDNRYEPHKTLNKKPFESLIEGIESLN